jgi:hypothetical protein
LGAGRERFVVERGQPPCSRQGGPPRMAASVKP